MSGLLKASIIGGPGVDADCSPSFTYTLKFALQLRKITKENAVAVAEESWAQLVLSMAVLFTESLGRPADFRSLSADAPDDCGHPSVSTSVFQVAEIGGCLHQLVLNWKSRLWCVFICRSYPPSEKARKWLQSPVGKTLWCIFRYYPENYLKGQRKIITFVIFADTTPIFEAVTRVCNTSSACYSCSFANLPLFALPGQFSKQSTLYSTKGHENGV